MYERYAELLFTKKMLPAYGCLVREGLDDCAVCWYSASQCKGVMTHAGGYCKCSQLVSPCSIISIILVVALSFNKTVQRVCWTACQKDAVSTEG